MKHVSIKDVAKALNCSVSTISRALNDKYDIRPETRDKIIKAAKEMGYSPNPIARKLTQKQSYSIGVVIPEFVNSFFPEVIIGIQEVFFKKGYQVLIMQSNEQYEYELANLKRLVDNFVDGIIISLTKESDNLTFIRELIERNYPLVLFNRVDESLEVSKVIFDDYKMTFLATEHLISQGITDLMYLGGPIHLSLSKNRRRGFMDALNKHKLPTFSSQIIETEFSLKSGEEIVEKLISENKVPKGLVCINDPIAIGAIKALKNHGYKIPQDVALIGFSESPMASIIEPSLSSVLQPTREMGKLAAELLLKQIESNSVVPMTETIILPGTINIRESSKITHDV
ncbi:LacI family DNA-binding transcriptional regulator [Flavobacterium sp. FlaQc-48]|uniref:LacI family DNA-binding transcriptional regulator n=1 Tax=Flavobacterium sp. FlaQc-48 TaxID=3374181 RepID=UPI003756F7E4